MIGCSLKIEENCHVLVNQFHDFRSKTLGGGGPRVVVSTAAFHARVRGLVPGLDGLKEQKCFFPIHV